MIINIHLHPKSSIQKIIYTEPNNLEIYLRAMAVNNKANIALIELLSKSLDIPKSLIAIKSGQKSKFKVLMIEVSKEVEEDIIKRLDRFYSRLTKHPDTLNL